MKISGIDIGEYRQFKDIKFDFTYPDGHPKAGKPLEKVCFIGQSGTGKTTLLNVIWELCKPLSDTESFIGNQGYLDLDKRLGTRIKNYEGLINYKIHLQNSIEFETVITHENSKDWFKPLLKNSEDIHEIALNNADKICIFIKDSIAREADAFLFDQKEQPQTFSDFVKTNSQVENEKADYEKWINAAGARKAISLGDLDSLSTWKYLLNDINHYDDETPSFMINLGHQAKGSSAEAFKELQKWLDKNPRIALGEKCLNPLLDKFFLEVDPGGAPNAPISIKTKHGIKIDSKYLSTGTRQLLATAIPIYKFDTKDTIILFDEPERSLFPDIQRGLISYYTGLAPEAQFFFATHSPIIAAAFEPCERFILYFDENGEVKCRNGVAPIGDDPNDVLRQDFGMSPLMLDEGVAAYEEYRQLAMQIRQESDESRKNELIAKRLELGNRYNF